MPCHPGRMDRKPKQTKDADLSQRPLKFLISVGSVHTDLIALYAHRAIRGGADQGKSGCPDEIRKDNRKTD